MLPGSFQVSAPPKLPAISPTIKPRGENWRAPAIGLPKLSQQGDQPRPFPSCVTRQRCRWRVLDEVQIGSHISWNPRIRVATFQPGAASSTINRMLDAGRD